jgi:hypothetical protein
VAYRDLPVVRPRGLAGVALADELVLETRSFVSDGGGGGTIAWAASGTVACRVDPLAGGEGEDVTANRLSDRSTHLLTVPKGTTVLGADRVVVAGRGTFEVTAVRSRTREMQITAFEAAKSS